jgi:hypothetical protein
VEDRRGAFVLMPLPPVVVLPAGRAAREVRGAILKVCALCEKERYVRVSCGRARRV